MSIERLRGIKKDKLRDPKLTFTQVVFCEEALMDLDK
jgi:hypothetical protein